jgi:hypothetical protein
MKRPPVHKGEKLRPGLKRSGQEKTISEESKLKGLRRIIKIGWDVRKSSGRSVGS